MAVLSAFSQTGGDFYDWWGLKMAADILQSQRRKAGDRGKTTDGDRKIKRTLLACSDRIWTGSDLWRSYWLYHPIRLIGHLISFGKTAPKVAGKSPKNRLWAGGILWILVDFDQYRDSMSDAVGGREDPPGCFCFF